MADDNSSEVSSHSSQSSHSTHSNHSSSSSHSSHSGSSTTSQSSHVSASENASNDSGEIPTFQHPLLIDQVKKVSNGVENPFSRRLSLRDSGMTTSTAPGEISTTSTVFICAKCHLRSRIHYQEAIKCKECGFRIMHKARDTLIKPMLTAGYGYKFDH